MTSHPREHELDGRTASPPPADELDHLLRRWHDVHAERARAGRDELLAALEPFTAPRPAPVPVRGLLAALARPQWRAAASLLLLVGLIALLLPGAQSSASAKTIMVPQGGRLDALDDEGRLIGPCPLAHTDVAVSIAGRFARVTVEQRFHNPYGDKIEAVYTFPLSRRAAIDRMKMTVGDRVVIGEVKERGEARRVYEAARGAGYVASLLEQERPNIFTQSVANIEPGAEVLIEISYVELVAIRDGEHVFDFPMTVAPRYIPGRSLTSPARLPAELRARNGAILRGPARLVPAAPGGDAGVVALTGGALSMLMETARPIQYPGTAWWGGDERAEVPAVRQSFVAEYADGSKELGALLADGTGQLGNRWFYVDLDARRAEGAGFAADTNEVPDASRVTPMPVRPEQRAGHDISVRVAIDTGGPAIDSWQCASHDLARHADKSRPDRMVLTLDKDRDIPNRDLVLSWRPADETITDAHFVHRDAERGDGFFTLVIAPPARVNVPDVRARELVFVLDCSGSMEKGPIEKAKDVMRRAIESMRDGDRFNVVTFNNSWEVLWDEPRASNEARRTEALSYVDSRQGGGGTEMRPAVLAALEERGPGAGDLLTPKQLADLPADGRSVSVRVAPGVMEVLLQDGVAPGVVELRVRDDLAVRASIRNWTIYGGSIMLGKEDGRSFVFRGTWATRDGKRLFDVDRAEDLPSMTADRVRYLLFLSDGEVGNDDAVIEAVRAHAGRTRVFTMGIGSSPNRSLLDAMASAGRGAADYVALDGDADGAVERFARRIETPVLTDISVDTEGVELLDTIPPLDAIPDLFDASPLIIHGRYAEPGRGALTVRGNTGRGPWKRTFDLDLPEAQPAHDVIASLWARAKVGELEWRGDVPGIVALGEEYHLLTAHTSFVAVERARITIDGAPRLVAVPVEMPRGQSWAGTMGGLSRQELALYERLRASLGADGAAVATLGLTALPSGGDQVTLNHLGRVVTETATAAPDATAAATGWRSVPPDRNVVAGLPSLGVAAAPEDCSTGLPSEDGRSDVYYSFSVDEKSLTAVAGSVRPPDTVYLGEQFKGTAPTFAGQALLVDAPAEESLTFNGQGPAATGVADKETISADIERLGALTATRGLEATRTKLVDRSGGASAAEVQNKLPERRSSQGKLVPGRNLSGTAVRGESDFMDYAEGWPGSSLVRANEVGAADTSEGLAVRLRLDSTAITLDLSGRSFEQVISLFEGEVGFPVSVDWGSLEAIGVERTTPVTARIDGQPAPAALDLICGALTSHRGAPLWYVQDGLILIAGRRSVSDGPGEEGIEAIRAITRAASKLDERLWSAAFGAEGAEAAKDAAALTRVTVLAQDVTPSTLAALREAGLCIEGYATGRPVVVGVIAPRSLRGLAELDVVRRVELAVVEDASGR